MSYNSYPVFSVRAQISVKNGDYKVRVQGHTHNTVSINSQHTHVVSTIPRLISANFEVLDEIHDDSLSKSE